VSRVVPVTGAPSQLSCRLKTELEHQGHTECLNRRLYENGFGSLDMLRRLVIFFSCLLFVAIFWGTIVTVNIYRYPADVPPVNLDAKYKTGAYQPVYLPPILIPRVSN
jgi:hypothetical protein